jgi:FkbM family methyltransferase
MLYLVTDQYIGQSLDRYGEFSEGEQELFRRLVQPGWTIVEIGANMGAHTIPLARAVGFRGTVHAFEPQRVLFQFLCANIALNALGHVHAHQVALGRQVGTLVVPRLNYSVAQNFGGLELGRWQDGEPVPAATVDTLNLPACHFLKVDVEGMEEDVLVGAEHTIRRCQPLLYVENDREDKSADLIRYLLGLGYRLFWHVPALFNPRNYFGVAENIFGKIVSVNMLGLPAPAVQDTPGLREITSPEDSWKTLLE